MSKEVSVIAIDGPSGSGKGVITGRVSKKLGYHILDSGALYRLVGLAAHKRGVPFDDQKRLGELAATLKVSFTATGDEEEPLDITLDGESVTRLIRTDQAGVDASAVAPFASVRSGLRDLQHSFAQPPGLVADGRDMGTVVFPAAELKIYLTASAEARAQRRYKQLKDKDIGVSLHALLESIEERDERDMSREIAPLVAAADAVVIDSTDLTIDEVYATIMHELEKKGLLD